MMAAVIACEDFSFQYRGAPRPALRRVTWTVRPGEFVLVTGPTGSGKSTLLRLVNGLVPHFYPGWVKGTVEVLGRPGTEVPPNQRALQVGTVFQFPEEQLVASTVWRDVAFGLENLGLPREEIFTRVAEALKEVGLTSLRDRPIHTLSGGEQQRLALASTLAMEASVLLLDEPAGELDPRGRRELLALLKRLSRRGRTLILADHRIRDLLPLVDSVVVMEGGRVLRSGPPREVFPAMGGPKGASRPPALPPRASLEDPLVQLRRVDYTYPNGIGALRGVNWSLYPGEVVALLGENGSGKTTLARLMAGLLEPESGIVAVRGLHEPHPSRREWAQRVGLVFQNPDHQIFEKTVEAEVAFGPRNLQESPESVRRNVDRALRTFGLERLRHRPPAALSGGERKEVAFASTFALEPQVLLLDEPTKGMDPARKEELGALSHVLADEGRTVVFITHDLEFATAFASRALLLHRGEALLEGPLFDVLSDPRVGRAGLIPEGVLRETGSAEGVESALPVEELSRDPEVVGS